MKKIVLLIQVLCIISLGAFTGAMTMLYTAVLSFWKKAPPEDFLNWYSDYSSGITTTTGPLVVLSIILPLICIFLVVKIPKSRVYWIISFLFCAGIMVITMNYFVEVNSSFANKSIELSFIKETLNTWGKLHIIRILMAFVSSVFAGAGMITYLSKNE